MLPFTTKRLTQTIPLMTPKEITRRGIYSQLDIPIEELDLLHEAVGAHRQALQPMRIVVGEQWLREQKVTSTSRNYRYGRFKEHRVLLLSCGHYTYSTADGKPDPSECRCMCCGFLAAIEELRQAGGEL